MIRSALPPAPLKPADRAIVIPAANMSTSQRRFIRASAKYARGHRDAHLDDTLLYTWKIEPDRPDFEDED